MKKFITFCFSLFLSIASFAITINISVANFSFSPSTVNASVGDVIRFIWTNGGHTTTCGSGLSGTSLPAGAAEWNSPMTSSNTVFNYTLTQPGTYIYGCIPHWPSMQGTLNVTGVAPVNFGSFNTSASDKNISLNWTTFSEQNTDYFSIRKSTDGNRFDEIAKVPAAGNSTTLKTYSYADVTNISKSKYLYYEIATVDKDGKTSLSEIKLVRTKLISDKLIVQLGPNPIKKPQQLMIMFNADARAKMDVKIYSLSGKLVLSNKIEAFYGLNNSHLHVCDLSPGQYVAAFTLAGKKESKTITIQ